MFRTLGQRAVPRPLVKSTNRLYIHFVDGADFVSTSRDDDVVMQPSITCIPAAW